MSECLAEKSQAWDELVRRFGPVVYGTIRKQLARFGCSRREDLAEDAYQEVFLTLSRDRMLGRLTDTKTLPGYLSAVAVSKAVDAVRGMARSGAYVEWTSDEAGDDLACPQPNPRDEAQRRDVRDLVERELSDLPVREALVVRLKWQHDMTLQSIARQLELPTGTVATVLQRARDLVRSRLEDKGIEG